jgi:hypothetical protein
LYQPVLQYGTIDVFGDLDLADVGMNKLVPDSASPESITTRSQYLLKQTVLVHENNLIVPYLNNLKHLRKAFVLQQNIQLNGCREGLCQVVYVHLYALPKPIIPFLQKALVNAILKYQTNLVGIDLYPFHFYPI